MFIYHYESNKLLGFEFIVVYVDGHERVYGTSDDVNQFVEELQQE